MSPPVHSPFSQLTAIGFLQTFVLEIMQLCESEDADESERFIERIAKSAGQFFEEAYREEMNIQGDMAPPGYADLIVGLKNRIGGDFSLVSASETGVEVTSRCCPFGDGVRHSPGLCRMTSSVFGGIAARNFGYAKVELAERIALGDGACRVRIHFDPEAAKAVEGLEYYRPNCELLHPESTDDLEARVDERLHALWRQGEAESPPGDLERPILIARSSAMKSVLASIETLAPTPATVLIEGETGVGKELAARAIHAMSNRFAFPFIAVNCGAIPEGLVESVLFGHEKGAFTGAVESHRGYFERAHGGTLFLDEIDALTPQVQVRLLRVLQEGEIERVGGQRMLPVNVRIIAATNYGLSRAVEEGRFRRDLYYRIHVVSLMIPRLSERPDDIPALVDLILRRLSLRYQKPLVSVAPRLMSRLKTHDWPGNVRELENTLERAFLFAKGSELSDTDVSLLAWGAGHAQDFRASRKAWVDRHDRETLDDLMKRYRGDVEAVAKDMEITRRAVYQKLKQLNLRASAYRTP